MARTDLGLDIAGYKDFVNNLSEFARTQNNDLHTFTPESLFSTSDMPRDKVAHSHFTFDNHGNDPLKEEQIAQSINFTIRKLLREHNGFLNKRDYDAVECLIKDIKKYMYSFPVTFGLMSRLYKRKLVQEKEAREEEIALL